MFTTSYYFPVCFFMALLTHYNQFKISNFFTTGVQHVPQSPSCPYQASFFTVIAIIIIIVIIIISIIIIIIIIIIVIISNVSRD